MSDSHLTPAGRLTTANPTSRTVADLRSALVATRPSGPRVHSSRRKRLAQKPCLNTAPLIETIPKVAVMA